MLLHLGKLLPEAFKPAADMPPVGLQLAFPRAPGADAAAQPGHSRALAREPRQQIFQLSKLHLQLALPGSGPGSKNIQNQHGPVDDPDLRLKFQIADLCGRQLAVEDNQIDLLALTDLFQLLQPSAADARGSVGLLPLLDHRPHRLGAGALR